MHHETIDDLTLKLYGRRASEKDRAFAQQVEQIVRAEVAAAENPCDRPIGIRAVHQIQKAILKKLNVISAKIPELPPGEYKRSPGHE